MNPRVFAPLVLLALALLGAGWWFIVRDVVAASPDPPVPQPAPREMAKPPIDTGEAHSDLASAAEGDQLRRPITEPEAMTAGHEPVLSGRVIDDVLGTPLVDASVVVSYRLHGEYSNLDLAHNKASRPLGEVATDAGGRFQLHVPQAVPLDVEVTARGYATARRSHLFAGEDVLLRLAHAAILEGVLTGAADGAPVQGALVRGWDKKRVELFRARTGPGGAFHFDDLEAGVITVAIQPKALAAPPWKKIELRVGTRTRLDLELEAGVKIHGTVRDGQGRPVVGAEIGEGWTFRKSVFTNSYGEYELFGFGGPGVYDIHVRAGGFGGDQHQYPYDAMPAEDSRLDFVLERGRSATGRVVDSSGAPLEGVYAAGVASQSVSGDQKTDWESSLTGPDGRFEMTSLDTSLSHQLFLRKEGFGTCVYDFPVDEAQRESVDLGDFVLVPGGRIAGMLRTQTGAPIPDYTVKLRGTNRDLGRLRPDTNETNTTWYTSVRESRTDAGGRFQFADVASGDFEVTATVRGNSEVSAQADVQLPQGGRVEEVELTLDFGVPITGFVETPDGRPAIGVHVRGLVGEQGGRISSVSGAGGRFELLGVSEEMGDVALVTNLSSYNWANPDARLAVSSPIAARAGEANVRLTLRELVLLTGRVEDSAGQPIAGMFVSASPSGSPSLPGADLASALTDEEGCFSLELPMGGHVDLETGKLRRDGGRDSFVQARGGSVRLEWIASDARDVLLRLLD